MITTTIWILVFAAWLERPATVVATYHTEAACSAAIQKIPAELKGSKDQMAFCIKGDKT